MIDQAGRTNFPTRHPLNQSSRRSAVVSSADVIMGLEATDFWNALNTMHDQVRRTSRPIMKADAKLISITAGDLYTKANYQDFYRYMGVDLAMAADAEATLPSLLEETKRLITADRKRAMQDRGAKLAAAHDHALEQARTDATYAWDATPVSTGRLCTELWAQIKDEDWSFVSGILRHFRLVADTAVGFRQAIPVHRQAGRWRNRLQRAGHGGRCPGEQEARSLLGQHSG